MDIGTKRVYRLSCVVTLCLGISYGMGLSVPFFAPLLAFFLVLGPAPPLQIKQLVGLVVLVCVTMLLGVSIVPILVHYTLLGLLIVGGGTYYGTYLAIHNGKVLSATFLIMGLTLISATGTLSTALALAIIQAMVFGIVIAVLCHWLVYPFFPEDYVAPKKTNKVGHGDSHWLSVRATIIVMPVYLLTLINPLAYLPIIMKAVALGQQESPDDAKAAAKELIGSTFLGGCYAICIWLALDLVTTLWAFMAMIFLFTMYFAAKAYGLSTTIYSVPFWQNTAVTMIILLGSAVQDSANGKDVYKAFWVRMGLFLFVSFYAWATSVFLEYLRQRRKRKKRAVGLV